MRPGVVTSRIVGDPHSVPSSGDAEGEGIDVAARHHGRLLMRRARRIERDHRSQTVGLSPVRQLAAAEGESLRAVVVDVGLELTAHRAIVGATIGPHDPRRAIGRVERSHQELVGIGIGPRCVADAVEHGVANEAPLGGAPSAPTTSIAASSSTSSAVAGSSKKRPMSGSVAIRPLRRSIHSMPPAPSSRNDNTSPGSMSMSSVRSTMLTGSSGTLAAPSSSMSHAAAPSNAATTTSSRCTRTASAVAAAGR